MSRSEGLHLLLSSHSRLLLVWRLSVDIKWRACLRNYGTCWPEICTDNFRGHSAVLIKQVNSWTHLRSPRLRPTDDLLRATATLLFQKTVSKYNICLKSGLVEVQSLGPTSWKKRISVNCQLISKCVLWCMHAHTYTPTQ